MADFENITRYLENVLLFDISISFTKYFRIKKLFLCYEFILSYYNILLICYMTYNLSIQYSKQENFTGMIRNCSMNIQLRYQDFKHE